MRRLRSLSLVLACGLLLLSAATADAQQAGASAIRGRAVDAQQGDLFAEIFNVTDEPNFNNPSGDQRSGNFLRVNSLVGGGIPRQLQLGVRFGF